LECITAARGDARAEDTAAVFEAGSSVDSQLEETEDLPWVVAVPSLVDALGRAVHRR